MHIKIVRKMRNDFKMSKVIEKSKNEINSPFFILYGVKTNIAIIIMLIINRESNKRGLRLHSRLQGNKLHYILVLGRVSCLKIQTLV